MAGDLFSVLIWWATIFGIGLLTLPLTVFLFSKFWDNGYIFSKTFSLIIITYLILVLGIFKILPFNFLGLSILGIILIIFNFWFLFQKQRYQKFLKTIKSKYKIFITQELIFLLILVFWSWVRGFAPDIEGLEKYMDWGFVNSALRAKFLPPQDMWFSGEIINYYYFGHLIFALITKLSGIVSSVGYNLSIATVCTLTFTSAFSLVSNVTHFTFNKKSEQIKIPRLVKGGIRGGFGLIITAGLISSLLLTFGGNLHSVFKIAKNNYTQNNNHFVFTKQAITSAVDSYWYPDATRFIGHDPDVNDKTIHEFPLYSFVVADLHGHMNDIFIVIFFLAILFVSFTRPQKFFDWTFLTLSGFILSVCYMTNAWDFAVYGLVLAIFTLFFNYQKEGLNSLIKTISNGVLVIALWYLFSYPFSINFIPMMEGIRISDGHSPFYQLFVLYGGFWIISLPFIILIIKKFIENCKLRSETKSTFGGKIENLLPVSDCFIFSLIVAANLLIIIPELIYIKDIYVYDYRRANTMFKLVYQAFILYSLVSGYLFIRLNSYIYKTLFIVIFGIHLIYPYFAIKSYYNKLKNYRGLDGLTYLQNLYPDNYQAILWLNKNISGQPTILEAVGDSYTTFNQISSATGLPTVQGWVVHEWLWRGGYDAPAARQTDVETIFTSTDIPEIKDLINKYQIKYIFVGAKEFEKYPNLDPSKFKQIGGKVIFQSGKTTVYQL